MTKEKLASFRSGTYAYQYSYINFNRIICIKRIPEITQLRLTNNELRVSLLFVAIGGFPKYLQLQKSNMRCHRKDKNMGLYYCLQYRYLFRMFMVIVSNNTVDLRQQQLFTSYFVLLQLPLMI